MNTNYSSGFQVWILCKVAVQEIIFNNLAVIVCVMPKMSEGFVFSQSKFLLQTGLLG